MAPGCACVPPVRLVTSLAEVREHPGRLKPLPSTGSAELPELGGRPFVVVDEGVEVELVDSARIELGETGAHVLKKSSQLRLVVRRDQFSRGTALRLVAGQLPSVFGPVHEVDLTAPLLDWFAVDAQVAGRNSERDGW